MKSYGPLSNKTNTDAEYGQVFCWDLLKKNNDPHQLQYIIPSVQQGTNTKYSLNQHFLIKIEPRNQYSDKPKAGPSTVTAVDLIFTQKH